MTINETKSRKEKRAKRTETIWYIIYVILAYASSLWFASNIQMAQTYFQRNGLSGISVYLFNCFMSLIITRYFWISHVMAGEKMEVKKSEREE